MCVCVCLLFTYVINKQTRVGVSGHAIILLGDGGSPATTQNLQPCRKHRGGDKGLGGDDDEDERAAEREGDRVEQVALGE